MTPTELKTAIDSMSLREMLKIWRFSEPGNAFLSGEVGEYFSKRMFAMRDAESGAWIAASKSVGCG